MCSVFFILFLGFELFVIIARQNLCFMIPFLYKQRERKTIVDIWNKLIKEAKKQYTPEKISPFITAYHVAYALEVEERYNKD